MEHNLVIYKAILKRVTMKNRILSTKDTRRLKVSIIVVFRMGCLFYFRFLMVQDVLNVCVSGENPDHKRL